VANGRHVGGIGVLSLGRLEGSGGAGILNIHGTFAPGSPLDEFEATNVIFHADSTFQVELNGVHNAIEHDRLYVYDDIDLGGATLDVHLNFVPSAGMEFIIIRKISAGPITGTFAGLPEGAQFLMGDIPFHISYTGGNGNDVVLTVGNLPLRVTATRLEGGNGNGRLDRDECDNLFVTIENTGGIAYNGVSATLDSLEPRIAVTHAESSFGNIPALGPATNRSAFQIRIAPTYPCGNAAEFNLIIRSFGHSPIALPVRILSGTGGAPQVLSSTDTPMAIPNVGAVQSTITSPNTFVSGHLRVRLHATHPSAGQLRFRLRAPWGDEVLLAANRGGAAANYGINCARETVFDLDAPVNIAAASAPFYGTFAPEDDLSQFVNRFSDGDWTLIAEDTVAGAQGTLQCWSLEQAPAECNPGGGVCASCIPRVEGVLSPASPTMPQRLAGAGYPGACGNPRVCPGTDVETVGPYRYATHTFTNNGPTACVTAILYVPCGAWSNGLFAAAYLGDFNSAYPCANYLGDLGLRIHDYYGEGSAFSFRVPAGERFTIVVNEGNSYTDAGQGCGSYGLELHGLPCPQAAPTLHIANDAGPDNVRLHWSTAYPGFELQSRPSLGGLVIGGGFTNVNATPVVIDGHYSVTNKHHTKGNGFFRLRKP
jgi:subtilisin-like proprotein convertase family protein